MSEKQRFTNSQIEKKLSLFYQICIDSCSDEFWENRHAVIKQVLSLNTPGDVSLDFNLRSAKLKPSSLFGIPACGILIESLQ